MASGGDLTRIREVLEAAVERRRTRRIDYFKPYEKQQAFFDMGLTRRERLLSAGNQVGKSEAGAFETACHLTGDYPDWWLGRRWDRPVLAWAAGESAGVVRDVQQAKLCGIPGVMDQHGTGYIPKAAFVGEPSRSRGIADAYDSIQVRHASGGISTLLFKSYEQGRTKFQGASIDFGWADEEPAYDIYSELLTRTNATGGMVFLTFTPLKGMSDVVLRFYEEESPDRGMVVMTIDDAKHIPPEERVKIIKSYKPWERDARTKGIPMLGEGRVFQIDEGLITEPAIQDVPPHWAKVWGIDFGIAHSFGAALLLYDRDNDIIHVHQTIRLPDTTPIQHAAAMKSLAAAVPVAWPHDGNNRDKGSGESLAAIYRAQGLRMWYEHATFEDGGLSFEAGLAEMMTRMETGRLMVASHLTQWFEEFRLYHRKKGLVVKVKDDLLSATRIGVMMRRIAKAVPLGPLVGARRRGATEARDVDFDPF